LQISGGILSDCWKPEQRGKSLAIYTTVPLMGPAAGAILGGLLEQTASWRWSFWVTSASLALLQLLALLWLHESHYQTLKKRTVTFDPGNTNSESTAKETITTALKRPFRLLFTRHTIQLLAAFSGISFGILYIWLSSLPMVFVKQYNEATAIAALHFITIGIGFIIGVYSFAVLTDRMYANRAKDKRDPEQRLALLLPSIAAAALGLCCFGWSAQERIHWTVPDLGLVIFSAGTQFSTQCINAYVIDVYGPLGWAASAMAGVWTVKSLAGFAFPMFGPDLVKCFGWGWSNSILATVLLAVGVPVSLSLRWYGEGLRKASEREQSL
jgi:MFS family permease